MLKYFFWKLALSTYFLVLTVSAAVDSNPFKHSEILDKDGRYHLEWLVDWPESRIYFNVTVKTKGYVGFGLSRKGKMSGADMVIGGVLPGGQPYFTDRHAIGNQLPVEDDSQDWTLHEAWERGSLTFLSFSRPFDTCDKDQDLEIHRDNIAVIWAFGERDDEIEYHFQNRGVFLAYLLDPDLTPKEFLEASKNGQKSVGRRLGEWNVWSIPGGQVIPQKETTYICSIHKVPSIINRKNHAVAVSLHILKLNKIKNPKQQFYREKYIFAV